MVLCGLGMQQYVMHNATTQKTIFFELGVHTHTHTHTLTDCEVSNKQSSFSLKGIHQKFSPTYYYNTRNKKNHNTDFY